MALQTREAELYLVLTPNGVWGLAARITTKPPKLAAREVAMTLTVKVPSALFEKPALRATVQVPADAVNRPVIDAAVADNIRQELERTLGVDVTIAVIEPEAAQS